jgi:hypothetical protein
MAYRHLRTHAEYTSSPDYLDYQTILYRPSDGRSSGYVTGIRQTRFPLSQKWRETSRDQLRSETL